MYSYGRRLCTGVLLDFLPSSVCREFWLNRSLCKDYITHEYEVPLTIVEVQFPREF